MTRTVREKMGSDPPSPPQHLGMDDNSCWSDADEDAAADGGIADEHGSHPRERQTARSAAYSMNYAYSAG